MERRCVCGLRPLRHMRSCPKKTFPPFAHVDSSHMTSSLQTNLSLYDPPPLCPFRLPRIPSTPPPPQANAFQAVPIVDFALMCHLTVIPATAGHLAPYWPSKKRAGATRFRALVFVCVAVIAMCLFMYLPVGILGYYIFGVSRQCVWGWVVAVCVGVRVCVFMCVCVCMVSLLLG